MAKRSPWFILFLLVLGFGLTFIFFMLFAKILFKTSMKQKKPSYRFQMSGHAKKFIGLIDIKGVILDNHSWLEQFNEYKKDDKVAALVLRVDSPGGAVGSSQELYATIKEVRSKYKKPVVVSSISLNASGAYYLSVGADHILVLPGTIMGSIGVIMGFSNMEKLYTWAKIKRFSISSGHYKDIGSSYRKMREDEKQLFQSLINEVWQQFKLSVMEDRKLDRATLEAYADGRIFTGATAVELGFADEIGTFSDAIRKAASLAGLMEGEYEIIQRKERFSFLQKLFGLFNSSFHPSWKNLSHEAKGLLPKPSPQPLFLMPGFL